MASTLNRFVEGLEGSEALTRVAERVRPVAASLVGRGRRQDVLTGKALGHPAHPMIVIVPMSCWFSSVILDLAGGRSADRAANRLAGLGVLAAVPAAASGTADWLDTGGAERRVGMAHAVANNVSLATFALSWCLGRRGHRRRSVALRLAGATTTGLAGYLGGHLSYVRGVGVNTTAFQAGPPDWMDAGPLEAVPEVGMSAVAVDGVALLVTRADGMVRVLEDRCTHRGGPLHEGVLVDGCVECPWHGSRFDLVSGEVVEGPASIPQPVYEVRVVDGMVQVRRDEPGSLRTVPVAATALNR